MALPGVNWWLTASMGRQSVGCAAVVATKLEAQTQNFACNTIIIMV